MRSHYIELLDTLPGWREYIPLLEKKRQYVIKKRAEGVTLKEIAGSLGVSYGRAQQLEISAYNKLKVLSQWGGRVFSEKNNFGSRPGRPRGGRPPGSGPANS